MGIRQIAQQLGVEGQARPQQKPRQADEGADELTQMVDQVSVYDLACADTGTTPRVKPNGWAEFHDCPICGHHDDFGVNTETNLWRCHSASNTTKETGNAFDYLMLARGMDKRQASDWVREYTGNPRRPKPEPPAEVAQGGAVAPVQAAPAVDVIPITRGDLLNTQPPPPEVIYNLLRDGGVMGIFGASKIGKTWLAIELLVAMSTGGEWLGYRCERRRCLMVNPELNEASCINRVAKVVKAMGADPVEVGKGLEYIHGRGRKVTMEGVKAAMREEAKRGNTFGMVFVDSIYMCGIGNENDQEGVGGFLAELQAIGSEFGCVVAFTHHHSKGGKADTSPLDRMSGSGLFARYVDVLLDLTEVFPGEGMTPLTQGLSAYEMHTVLRDFASPGPMHLIYDFPIHRLDEANVTEGWTARGGEGQRQGGRSRGAQRQQQTDDKTDDLLPILGDMIQGAGREGLGITEAAKRLHMSHQTLNNRIDGYWRRQGYCPVSIYTEGRRKFLVLTSDLAPIESR